VFFTLVDYEDNILTTVAGNGQPGSGNGTGTSAQFSSPQGICVDASGNLYVGDTGNNQIRKITPAGIVTTFAGAGQAVSGMVRPRLPCSPTPSAVCVDSGGNVTLPIRQL